MPGIDISLAFFGTALFLAIAPGPDNIFVLTQSALFGRKAGFAVTLGLASGLCFHTIAVASGLAALLKASPWSLVFIKCAGAAYLCWLAWLCLRAGAANAPLSGQSFTGFWPLYRRGIIMNVTNPKVCLFFLAFLPQFCMPGRGAFFWQIVYFGCLFILATILVFGLVACLGGKIAGCLNSHPSMQIIFNRITAIIFLGMALALACTGV